jgi:nucleotide-binding universal stress UspA family protein
MATHTRHGLTQLVPGSVTEAALGAAGVPVLCVREPDHGVGLPYRRVLVPTDMSEASRRAFRMAALLADQFGAEVVALHVAPVAAAHSLAGLPELMETRVPSEEDVWRFLLPELLGLRVAPRVRLGSAWGWITRLAHEDKADVIVMSTHGHDSLGDRVLGSHTERVLRSAPCPVLVV